MKTPGTHTAVPSAVDKRDSTAGRFQGTENPRHLRALALLLQRPAKREELDRAAGCSNGPELVAELRRRGLDAPCERVPALDRDGRPCRPGVYSLTASDRRKVSRWLYLRGARRA